MGEKRHIKEKKKPKQDKPKPVKVSESSVMPPAKPAATPKRSSNDD